MQRLQAFFEQGSGVFWHRAVLVLIACVLATASVASGLLAPEPHQSPRDNDWTANAELHEVRSHALDGLGAAQGVSVRGEHIYIYGDADKAHPRVGVIRQYTRDLKPTGKVVWLLRDGQPALLHPTGLTWDSRWGTFLGDTVAGKAVIYRLDWDRMWRDGNLDGAILDRIEDDAAQNGCRPEFVSVGGVTYLATADYGKTQPEIRLYDPAKLIEAKRTTMPGVLVHRIRCGPYNQNLHWDAKRGYLVCVQNVIGGRGWRLDVLDLDRAIAAGDVTEPGVRVQTLTFPPHNELEGYRPLDATRGIFLIGRGAPNVFCGKVNVVEEYLTPAGNDGL